MTRYQISVRINPMKISIELTRNQIFDILLYSPDANLSSFRAEVLGRILDNADASGRFSSRLAEEFLNDIRSGHCNPSNKISYIRRAREAFPGISLSSAKYMVEDLAASAAKQPM